MEALRRILEVIGDPVGRQVVRDIYAELFECVARTERLRRTDGREFLWEYADPSELLRLTLRESDQLQLAYAHALEKYPCSGESPWHMIIGYDEFCPGDKLKVNNERKTMDLIFSFAELGQDVLSTTHSWLMPVTLRHTKLCKIEGGWSRVFCLILRKLFMGGESFGTSGVAVMIRGRPHIIHATLHWIIADGDGHRMTMCWKGARGLKPSLIHSNVLMKEHPLLESLSDHVDICCHDVEKFKVRTSADFALSAETIRAAHELRQTRHLTQELYKEIEKSEGFTFSALGVPWDEELLGHVDVFSAVAMDWVHSALSDGSMSVEAKCLLAASASIGQSFPQVETFLKRADWEFPNYLRHKMTGLHRVFSHWRVNTKEDGQKVRCLASELLSVYGLVRNFTQTVIGEGHPELAPNLESFFACCNVIDIFLKVKHRQMRLDEVTVDLLDEALSNHLRLHKAAYGTEHIKPKHHWLFDVACRLRRRDLLWFLVDCFVLERSHLTARDVADNVKNTRSFERSVLAGVLNKQIYGLKKMVASGAMLDFRSAPMPGYPQAQVADNMNFKGQHISVGDVVLSGDNAAGVVLACAQEGDEFFVIVETLVLIEQVTPQSATWRMGVGPRAVWDASRILMVQWVLSNMISPSRTLMHHPSLTYRSGFTDL